MKISDYKRNANNNKPDQYRMFQLDRPYATPQQIDYVYCSCTNYTTDRIV